MYLPCMHHTFICCMKGGKKMHCSARLCIHENKRPWHHGLCMRIFVYIDIKMKVGQFSLLCHDVLKVFFASNLNIWSYLYTIVSRIMVNIILYAKQLLHYIFVWDWSILILCNNLANHHNVKYRYPSLR